MAVKLKAPELSQSAATAFAEKWKSFTDEKQHARGFWSDFFKSLCNIDDEEIAGIEYEKRVKSTLSGNQEYIDVYWKNVALIEHKSAGQSLDKAELQARGYWLSLAPGYRPKTIIVSDFLNFRIVDVSLNRTHEFPLSKLAENIHRFEAIISGNRTRISSEEISVDQQAAKLMANLYLELEAHGFEGHETSIFLVRLLFLLFGDDTGMWSKNLFLKLVMGTKENGSDVGTLFDQLFEVLDTPQDKRKKGLPDSLKDVPYVNGEIFSEKISVIDFNKKMRVALVDVANYNWTTINPTIFGSLFQLIKDKEARRELGEHYTSEENINKIVYPLFLEELQERLAAAWDNKKELKKLRQDLSKIKILDPACGCGNFLVVSYRHLRQLELELIIRLNNLEGNKDSIQLDGSMGLSISLNQFYGIEIEEWPAQVARMALFLTEHQENLKLERITGESPKQFPIKNSTHIVIANSLSFDWNKLVTADENLKIIGNPPFLGRVREKTQTTELIESFDGAKGSGNIDYVCAWYAKAAKFIRGSKTKVAFVSTNSIVQGEQPGILWEFLKRYNLGIDFAYQTFPWTNDASGQAAVYCVIIGFSDQKENNQNVKRLFDSNSLEYKNVNSINRYLLDAPDRSIRNRKDALSPSLPKMKFGSMPHDGGFLLLSVEEKQEIITSEPEASKFIRKLVGADELINNLERYCIWVKDEEAILANRIKSLRSRAEKVRKTRLESPSADAVAAASRPLTFKARRQPTSTYIAVPSVSSDKRVYIPIAVYPPEVIVTNLLLTIDCATDEIFALLNSSIFNIWNRKVSGRLGNAARVSAEITYNNFPVPELTGEQIDLLRTTGRDILNVRETFGAVKLAELYDPISMPEALRKAHDANDKVSLKIYGLSVKSNQDEILSRLFEIYEKLDNVNKLSD
jgi:hypothetical protein